MQRFLEIPKGALKLAACIHHPGKSAVPIVICCHGLTGTKIGSSYRLVAIARLLEPAGIATIRFDFAGCGESEGRFEEVTAGSQLDDLRAVIAFLQAGSEFDMSRVAIVGSSFGAYTAARATHLLSGLRCSVFLAPVADPRRLTDQGMPPAAVDLLRKRGWVDHHGLKLCTPFFDTLPTEDVPAMLARAGAPLLVFHGQRDDQVPISEGRSYEKALNAAGVPVDLRVLDTADHGMRGVEFTEKIVNESVDWLTRHLSP